MTRDTTAERYCGHCEKYTTQDGRDSDHERDSSADFWMCRECGWSYTGFTGEWRPPPPDDGGDR
jgi:ribosomal protein L37AE/L43A